MSVTTTITKTFPLDLIPTPTKWSPKSHIAVTMAKEMCLVHNALILSLNSIHAAAPHVHTPSDIKDFLFYSSVWCSTTHHHHDTEEKHVFPFIEQITGTPGLMERNITQHAAFHSGLERFEAYASTTTPETYNSADLIAVLDSFVLPLRQHLSEEIDTLLELEKYDEEPLKKMWKDAEEKALSGATKEEVLPFLLGAVDRGFEGGRHAGFPPVPWFVRVLCQYFWSRKHAGAWRFSPCDFWGRVRAPFWEE